MLWFLRKIIRLLRVSEFGRIIMQASQVSMQSRANLHQSDVRQIGGYVRNHAKGK